MATLRYSEQAKADLLNIKRYLAHTSGSNELALKFTQKLRQQCVNIAELPATIGRCRPELHPDIRSFPYDNYVIFFRYDTAFVEIISIIERHRDIDALFN